MLACEEADTDLVNGEYDLKTNVDEDGNISIMLYDTTYGDVEKCWIIEEANSQQRS